jgi:hypothetical protein
MKKLRNLICLAIVAASVLFPGVVSASDGNVPLMDDQVVIGGTYTLEAGDVLDGSLIVIGGVVSLEPDSIVDGDILIFGGNVTVEGAVRDNLVAVGGVVVLTETAEIYGDLIAPATVVRRDENAQVYGQIIADTEGLGLEIPPIPEIPEVPEIPEIPDIPDIPDYQGPNFLDRYFDRVSTTLRPVTNFFWTLLRSFALAAVALLVLLFLPKHTERVTTVVEDYPVTAGGLGILTVLSSVPVMVITTVTIILIPATILISLLLVLGLSYGFIAVGSEVGRRIAVGLSQSWKRPLQTAVGTFALAFLTSIFGLVLWDWIASLLWVVVGSIGLGAVMMTRFGTREYTSSAKAQSAVVEAPALEEDSEEVAEAAAEEADVPEPEADAPEPKAKKKTPKKKAADEAEEEAGEK